MPFLLLVLLALSVGTFAGLAGWRYPRIAATPAAPAAATAKAVGKTIGRRRAFVAARLDPEVATGLALTLALALAIGGGLVLAVLAYLVRGNSQLIGLDNSVARWGNRHSSTTSTHFLNAVTQLGNVVTVVVLAVVLAIVETLRQRTVWVTAFLVTVLAGEEILTLAVKDLAGRVRPAFNPAAATLGPSFPSGHSATSAAFWAAAALLLGRWRSRRVRALLIGLAVGIAVGVAASRVLLDVHWLSDVVAGLALGWAWFAACGIAFGGRILRFGAAAEIAQRTATSRPVPRP
jgi:membrane-associated phospholipid phosphatase